jgi:hypothetical protein
VGEGEQQMIKLTINKCNHGTFAISLDDENGGTRLTPSKCCGSWKEVQAWELSAEDCRDFANLFESAQMAAIIEKTTN